MAVPGDSACAIIAAIGQAFTAATVCLRLAAVTLLASALGLGLGLLAAMLQNWVLWGPESLVLAPPGPLLLELVSLGPMLRACHSSARVLQEPLLPESLSPVLSLSDWWIWRPRHLDRSAWQPLRSRDHWGPSFRALRQHPHPWLAWRCSRRRRC
jgi:hypothetical protein